MTTCSTAPSEEQSNHAVTMVIPNVACAAERYRASAVDRLCNLRNIPLLEAFPVNHTRKGWTCEEHMNWSSRRSLGSPRKPRHSKHKRAALCVPSILACTRLISCRCG